MSAQQMLKVEDASKRCGVSTSSIYRWIKDAGGHHARVGNAYLVDVRDLGAIKKFRDAGSARRGNAGSANLATMKVAVYNANKSKVSLDKFKVSLKDINAKAERLASMLNFRIAQLETQIAIMQVPAELTGPKPSELELQAKEAPLYGPHDEDPPF